MCGILGVFNSSKDIDRDSFKRALLLQKHRGPDNQNVLFLQNNIALGHVRLSIIDLEERSNQPYEFNDKYLVFNGEIFNYLELKEELIHLGYNFNTDSDTEVVIKSYDCWGEKCVDKFNGMWAFYIYDTSLNELFVSRDRYGIKPLYYVISSSGVYLSSEIKSIIEYDSTYKEPNIIAIHTYLRESTGAQSKDTWFAGVYRLEPAHNLKIDIENIKIQKTEYWQYPTDKLNIDFEQAKKEYEHLFQDSVKLRMRSDVPVGLTLSSGLDSSTIAAVAEKQTKKSIQAFTASFPEEPYDEYPIVKSFTENTNISNNRVLTNYTDYLSTLDKLIYHLESGHSSPAIVPLHAVMDQAKEKVVVVLEGQGADELLAGYTNTYLINYLLYLIKSFKINLLLKELRLISPKLLKNSMIMFFRLKESYFIRRQMRKMYGIEKVLIKSKLLKLTKSRTNRLNDILIKQHTTGLANLLHYGDAVSMMHSLESRLPFMDYRLVEFVCKLPFEYKYKLSNSKRVHRESFSKILPKSIVDCKNKLGFTSPIKDIILSVGIRDIILSKRIFQRGIFKEEELRKLYQSQLLGKNDYSRFLYRVLSVELWYRKFID